MAPKPSDLRAGRDQPQSPQTGVPETFVIFIKGVVGTLTQVVAVEYTVTIGIIFSSGQGAGVQIVTNTIIITVYNALIGEKKPP